MAAGRLNREEAIGLGVAVAAHAALVALLVLQPPTPVRVPPPERIAVTISEDVGLTSTSPDPASDARPDEAPEIGEPAPPEPEPAPPRPEPVRRDPPPPPPKVEPKPQPKPQPKASPKPTASPRPAASRNPAAQASPRPSPTRAGGSRVGADFLKGVPGARATGTSQTPPAAAVGPAVRSALSGAISRQLKPHWAAPQGAEAELLVTYLSFNLNPDGSLAGRPTLVRQEGITEANRPQAARHAEQAIRAVQLAAPFDLPAEYHDAWKRVAAFKFDKRLAQ